MWVVPEAMACGLPIISSDLPFNDDILDKTNSLRINPTDIEAIKQAISRLKNDASLRHRLAEGAALKAQTLRIDQRVKRIIDIIQQ